MTIRFYVSVSYYESVIVPGCKTGLEKRDCKVLGVCKVLHDCKILRGSQTGLLSKFE